MRLLAIGVAAVVLALDLLTKWWVKNTDWLHYHRVIDGFFTIHYVRNEGIAFGLFHDNPSAWKPAILAVLAVAAAVMVLYYIWTSPAEERGVQLFFGLLLGGILGNFSDRLWRGYVVDFLEFHWQDRFAWPTFNVADAAITCGVAVILFQGLFGTGSADPASSRDGPGKSGSVGAILLAFLLLPPLLGESSSSEAEEIVERLEQRYERVKSFSADFRQVFQTQGIHFESDWGEGILLMKRPGKMYWEYRRPTRKLFVADGKQSFFYVPGENQVTISDLDLETANTPLLFLLGPKRIGDDFQVRFETGEGPVDESNLLLRLTPIQVRPEFSHVLVEVSPTTYLIHRLSIVEPIGNRNDYLFSRFRENVKIRDHQFRLKLPDGVEIIRIGSGVRFRPQGDPSRSPHQGRLDAGSGTAGEKRRVSS